MFLALKPFNKPQTAENSLFSRVSLRNFLWISLAEALTYPFSLIKARKCTYPAIKPNFSDLLLFRGVFYGLRISLQKTLFTFLLRSQLFQFFWHSDRENMGFLRKYQENCVFSAVFPCFLLNFLNIAVIRAQCSKLGPNMRRRTLLNTLKTLRNTQNSARNGYFQLARAGFFSNMVVNVAQALLEVKLFAIFFERKPEKPGRCVVFMSFLATLLTHPLEFLNIRLVLRAVSGLRTPNFVKYAVLLAKNEGISVFYRGFTANLLRNTAFNCIIFKKISHNFSIEVH